MSLAARLDAIRDAFLSRADDETKRIMLGATETLAASGQADRAVGEGDEAPPFDLPTSDGGRWSLRAALRMGPAVLTFFRGHW